jgi:hypothetical protein
VGTEGEMIFLKIIVYWFGVTILFFGALCANAMRSEKKNQTTTKERELDMKAVESTL